MERRTFIGSLIAGALSLLGIGRARAVEDVVIEGGLTPFNSDLFVKQFTKGPWTPGEWYYWEAWSNGESEGWGEWRRYDPKKILDDTGGRVYRGRLFTIDSISDGPSSPVDREG